MHILVTGAAGFIGSSLTDHLLARDDQVTGIDSFDPYYSSHEKRRNLEGAMLRAGFRLVEADVTNQNETAAAVRKAAPDVIVHLAARPGVRPSMDQPDTYMRVNLGGTTSVLEAAARAGVRSFVFASSSSVYGNTTPAPFREDAESLQPISPYGVSKRDAEAACREHHAAHGGGVVCVRLFTAYGPRMRPDLAIRQFRERLLRGEPVPVFGDGSTERDYTWIGDIVAGIVAAIHRAIHGPRKYEVFNVGSGRAVRLDRVLALISQYLQREPVIERLPPQPGDVPRTLADITQATRLLRYGPTTQVEIGLRQYLDLKP